MRHPDIVRLIIAFALCLFFWLLARSEHSKAQLQETENFQAPKLIAFLFGVYKSPTLLNARGILGQLFSFFLFFIFASNILGFIKSEEMTKYYILLVLLVFTLSGLVYVVSKIFERQ
jgi:hypothetical protein